MALPDDEIPIRRIPWTFRLWSALEQARIADFVHAQPPDWACRLESDAANLSGGQRQRIAIARAPCMIRRYLCSLRRPAALTWNQS